MIAVLWLLAQTQGAPDPGLWGLGVIAVALVVGAGITYRYVALPERARAEVERTERMASQERERKAYESTIPALGDSQRALDRLLQVLPSLEGRSP